jgi:hypothetical protein
MIFWTQKIQNITHFLQESLYDDLNHIFFML